MNIGDTNYIDFEDETLDLLERGKYSIGTSIEDSDIITITMFDNADGEESNLYLDYCKDADPLDLDNYLDVTVFDDILKPKDEELAYFKVCNSEYHYEVLCKVIKLLREL